MVPEHPLFAALAANLVARPRKTLDHERRAAVLVPIIDDGGPLRLLLTRRTEDTPTHKGHVAFPGGGLGPDDAHAVAAALREAEEEIGLTPACVEVLGLLDDLPTVNWGSVVTPVVGRVRRLPPLRPDPREVARIFEIPLDALGVPEAWRVQQVHRWGATWPMYAFEWDGELLWGLSAYVTMGLLDRGPHGAPHPLPAVPPRPAPGADREGTP